MIAINEIEELITLLEGEAPTSHGKWLSLRNDCLTCMVWLRQARGTQATWQGQSLEERLDRVLRNAEAGIKQYVSKPRLCLNAPDKAVK